MKASFYTESILYWLARGISLVSQGVPARVNVGLGRAAGTLLYHLLPSRRVVALASLRAAFGAAGPHLDEQRIVKVLFQNLGQTFMEVASIPRVDRAYVDRWITLSPGSRERLEEALARGKGVIFLTAHFGNWEFISLTGALHGYPSVVLAREQGWPRLNRLLTGYRESKGCRVVTKGFTVRQLVRSLKEGGIVGLLADQDGGRHGVLCPFLGRIASTAPGTFALSLSTGAPILPIFMIRENGPAHRLVMEDPLPIPETGSMEERIRQGLAAYLSVLERYVRRYPAQWLWLHRRWKSTPERRVLLLSDGKAGHLAQLQAFAERLEAAWTARMESDPRLKAISKPLVSVKTARVEFRHPIWRGILSLVASVVPPRFPGGDRWLRWALTPDSFQALQSAYGDLCVSCGASTAGVNLLWAWGLRARTVHLALSRFPSWRRFDLSVIPRHDRLASPLRRGAWWRFLQRQPRPPNVLRIDGALSPRRRPAQDEPYRWIKRLGLSKERQIGCLLGGPTRGVQLDSEDVKQAIQGLIMAAEEADAELLITSSRRTPPEVERWLKTRLGSHPRCRLLTLVNRSEAGGLTSTAEAVPCILGLAQAVVVSGDSISMVSEAVDHDKPVVTFPPKGNGPFSRISKYRRFLRQMDAEGKVKLVEPSEVGRTIVETLRRPSSPHPTLSPCGGEEKGEGTDPVVEYLKKWL